MTVEWPSVFIHPSQQPGQAALDLARSLRAGTFAAKSHYLSERQSRRWLAVHRAYAPSSGRVQQTKHAYHEVFEHLAKTLNGRRVQIISLGCGGGLKDAWLAQALLQQGCDVRYLAVDAGVSMVLEAAETVSSVAKSVQARRLVADVERAYDLVDFLRADERPEEIKIWLALNVIHNSDPEPWVAQVKRFSDAGDWLVTSANLLDVTITDSENAERIVPQYDNPLTRSWLSTVFEDLDLSIRGDELQFEFETGRRPERVCAFVRLREKLRVELSSELVEHPAGTRLQVFISNRFRVETVDALLEASGFRCELFRKTADEHEAVWVSSIA